MALCIRKLADLIPETLAIKWVRVKRYEVYGGTDAALLEVFDEGIAANRKCGWFNLQDKKMPCVGNMGRNAWEFETLDCS